MAGAFMVGHSYWNYWAKAGDNGSYHRFVFHALDVAACGLILLRSLSHWCLSLQVLSGLDDGKLEKHIPFYLSLHDLGKFATAFQNLRPDLLQRLQRRQSTKGYHVRHDTLGYWLWRQHVRSRFFPPAGQGRRRRRTPSHPEVDAWMQAVTGHHGQPPAIEGDGLLQDYFDTQDLQAAEGFVAAVLELFGCDTFPQPPAENAALCSWWLAGLTILADWLGSNQDFFPYRSDIISLEQYWDVAQAQAESAVAVAGLIPDPPAQQFTLSDCFSEPPAFLKPTPLQRWAERVPLSSGPHLFLLEDVTGAGKTEAALLLAQRLLRNQREGGLYFALPTMATANGMYQRLGPVYRRLYASESSPSLVLAHGRADLVAAFRESVLPSPTREKAYGDGTEPAGARCAAWLADSRKKALLAEVGVGTLDQGLLAVLPSRHQSLRLLGLLGKVLIVDEVHACDAYMNGLLEHLLRAHAHAGGSAILLSATLPYRQRDKLLNAFAKGAGWTRVESEAQSAYPLATSLSAQGLTETALDTRPEVQRRVNVEFLETPVAVEERLAEAVAAGRCACWIRNTVDEARQSFEILRSRHPDWQIELFHARFALADRLAIEQRVLSHFGKYSGPRERRGRILVATQVVEQSLDLDFDLVITDLAPIDLLIQRAGRLQRHSRDRDGQRNEGPDQRGTPCMAILAPPWEDRPGPRWLRASLPGTAAVYEAEDARLWQAMKLLRQRGGFTMPDDARDLIEGVYGLDPFQFPEGLQEKSLEADAQERVQITIAEDKVLEFSRGYRLDGPWLDEDSARTRLGEPTVTVWLARLNGEWLLPFCGQHPTDGEAWLQSALTLPRRRIHSEVLPEGVTDDEWRRLKEALPAEGKWGVVVVLESREHEWVGMARNADGAVFTLVYDREKGLKWQE